VLGTLDLALLRPYLAVGQGEVLVATAVPHGIEIVADAYQRNPQSSHIESAGVTRGQLTALAESDGPGPGGIGGLSGLSGLSGLIGLGGNWFRHD
jgi:hypothetical protein